MRRGPTGILCGKGSGTNTRPLTPLAFFLPLPLRERAGVRGDRGTRRRLNLLRRLRHGVEGKRPWIPAENLRE